MNSASTDRSISSGISLPQWMKSKIGDRYDLEQAAFSPPSEDDSFFFIKYPLSSETKFDPKVEVNPIKPQFSEQKLSSTGMKRSYTAPGTHLNSIGTEDSIKKESDPSRSMVSVAQNMLTAKIFGNYLTVNNNNEAESVYHRQRRNSKSLPTSPLTSPKLNRKNPYFTNPFAKPNETFENGKSGWILSILSQRKSIEDLTSNTESSTSENNSPNIQRRIQKYTPEPKPKPSELREMNFWSPVSM